MNDIELLERRRSHLLERIQKQGDDANSFDRHEIRALDRAIEALKIIKINPLKFDPAITGTMNALVQLQVALESDDKSEAMRYLGIARKQVDKIALVFEENKNRPE